MSKNIIKPILIFSGAVFLCGLLFGLAGSLLGGNPFRASANISRIMGDNAIIKFEYTTPQPKSTPIPYNNDKYYDYGNGYDIFGDSDIYEFFEEFGLGDDFFSPYGGKYPEDSGKVY